MEIRTNSLKDLHALVKEVDHLADDLTSASLINIEFIHYANGLLKQITKTRFDKLDCLEAEFASGLFKTSVHTQPSLTHSIFEEQLEIEVIQRAGALRETLRRAALITVINSGVPNELRHDLVSKAYILKCSLQDLWERCESNEYQGEPRSSIQEELS